jgi:hypothetical protein
MYPLQILHHLLLNGSQLFHSTNQLHHIPCPTHSLPYIRPPKVIKQYTFLLNMAPAMFAKMLDNSQHSTGSYLKAKALHKLMKPGSISNL